MAAESTTIADSLISLDTLAVACARLKDLKVTDEPALKVQAYCTLKASVSASGSDWDTWETVAIPTPAEISEASAAAKVKLDLTRQPNFTDPSRAYGMLGLTSLTGFATPSGLNESAILWGLTDFVVTRARENVNEYALGRLSTALCSVELKIDGAGVGPAFPILPGTCGILQQVIAGGKLPGLGALRDGLRRDLEVLPRTLVRHTAPPLLKSTDLSVREAAGVLLLTAELAYRLRSDGQFLRALAAASDSINAATVGIDCVRTPAAAALYQLSSLASVLTRGVTLQAERADRAIQVEMAIKTLIVNVRSSGRSERWPTGGSCASQDKPTGTRLYSPRKFLLLATALNEVINDVQLVRQSHSRDGAANEGQMQLTYARKLVESSFELIGLAVRAHYGESQPGFLSLIGQFQSASDALVRRDYGGAAIGALRVTQTLAGVITPEGSILTGVEPYVGLLADVAEADDAEGVTQALAQAAAPRTSYLRKRAPAEQEGKWKPGRAYFSVNAYAGGIAGWERLESTGRHKGFLGPYIPVGLEVGVPLSKNLSLGVFGHVIDVGALGSYRLGSESEVNAAPNVSFKQVFSPGLAIVAGVSRVPLTLGYLLIGASPRLRRVDTGGTVTESDVTRRGAFFAAFDIRLF